MGRLWPMLQLLYLWLGLNPASVGKLTPAAAREPKTPKAAIELTPGLVRGP